MALAATAMLSACATPRAGPVEVTRFARTELAGTQAGGISVVSAPGGDPRDLADGAARDAVARELVRLGYAQAGSAPTLAEVSLTRAVSAAERRQGPVTLGLGGGTGGYGGGGVGLGVGINLAGRPRDSVQSTLAVTLRDRASGRALWEGRATFAAPDGTPLAGSPAAIDRLARALFAGFPGRSGETVIVP